MKKIIKKVKITFLFGLLVGIGIMQTMFIFVGILN